MLTNFEIGRRIIAHEQQGSERAAYGKEVLKDLSERLVEEFERGFSRSNLKYMRKFYLSYKGRISEDTQIVRGELVGGQKSQTVSGKLAEDEKSQTVSGKLTDGDKFKTLFQDYRLLQFIINLGAFYALCKFRRC